MLSATSLQADESGSFGSCLCIPGDMNGDGIADVAVAARDCVHAGEIWILSGRNGELLRTLHAPAGWRCERDPFLTIPSFACAGDLDRDGCPDFVIGSSVSRAGTISGKDGHVLRLLGEAQLLDSAYEACSFGRCVAGGQDATGDGVPDMLVATPEESRVELFSGRDGSRVFTFEGRTLELQPSGRPSKRWRMHRSDRFGSALAFIADCDGDGLADMAIGAPERIWHGIRDESESLDISSGDASAIERGIERAEDPCWPESRPGCVEVFSSRDGQRLLAVRGPRSSSAFGHALREAPDLDGDGAHELLVSSLRETVSILSPRTGSILDQAALGGGDYGAAGSTLAWLLPPSPAGIERDLAQEGCVLVGGCSRSVDANWMQGQSAAELRFGGREPSRRLHSSTHCGSDVDVLPDLDGDGWQEIVLGIVLTREMPEAQGAIEVRVLSGRTLAVLWRAWPTLDANSRMPAAPARR